MPDAAAYSIYLVECGDGTFYTGIATDVARRLDEHRHSPRGAKYLRGKAPLKLVYQLEIGDRGLATRLEARVKRLPRAVKADLSRLSVAIRTLQSELSVVNTE
jgi:putative endonuclease